MKRIITILLPIVGLIFFPVFISAQGTQNRVQNPTTHISTTPSATSQGNLIQNQNQTATQNMGEENQLMVATQQMQMLMDMQGLDEGLGEQIRTIAREQVTSQTQTQQQLNKLDDRSAFMKKLFGADQNVVEALKGQVEENKLRIQKLEKLQIQIQNEEELTQLQNAVAALVSQNTALENRITAEENTGSLLGWLVRFFNK